LNFTLETEQKPKKKKEPKGDRLLRNELLNYDSPELEEICVRIRETMTGENRSISPPDFFQEVRLLQVSQMFSSKIRMFVSFEGLFFDTGISVSEIEKKLPFLEVVIDRSISVADVCSALETFVVTKWPQALREFPLFLQKFYAADLIDEKELLKYYNHPDGHGDSSTETYLKAKKAAEPFLKWLRDANEEDSSSSEDDQLEVITPSSRGPAVKSINFEADRLNFKSKTASNELISPTGGNDIVPPINQCEVHDSSEESEIDIDAL